MNADPTETEQVRNIFPYETMSWIDWNSQNLINFVCV